MNLDTIDLEAPLEGLIPTPLHLMSDSDLLETVRRRRDKQAWVLSHQEGTPAPVGVLDDL